MTPHDEGSCPETAVACAHALRALADRLPPREVFWTIRGLDAAEMAEAFDNMRAAGREFIGLTFRDTRRGGFYSDGLPTGDLCERLTSGGIDEGRAGDACRAMALADCGMRGAMRRTAAIVASGEVPTTFAVSPGWLALALRATTDARLDRLLDYGRNWRDRHDYAWAGGARLAG